MLFREAPLTCSSFSLFKQGASHYGQRNIYFCVETSRETALVSYFNLLRCKHFIFCHLFEHIFCHMKHYKVSHCYCVSLMLPTGWGFVCVYYQVFPTVFSQKNQSRQAFYWWKKSHIDECICCSLIVKLTHRQASLNNFALKVFTHCHHPLGFSVNRDQAIQKRSKVINDWFGDNSKRKCSVHHFPG